MAFPGSSLSVSIGGLSSECHTPRMRWAQAGSPWPVAAVAPSDAAAVPGHGCWSAVGTTAGAAPPEASVGVHVVPARPCGPMPPSLLAAGTQDTPTVPGSSGMLSARRRLTSRFAEQQQQQHQQSSFVPPTLPQPPMPAAWSPRGPQQQQKAHTDPVVPPEVSLLVQGVSADHWQRLCAGEGLSACAFPAQSPSPAGSVVHGSASVPVPAASTVSGAIRQISVAAKVPPCIDEAHLLRATTPSWEKSDSSLSGSLAFKSGTIRSGVATPCRVRTVHAPTAATSCRSQTPQQVNRIISCGTPVAPPSSPALSAAKCLAPVAQQRVCPTTPRVALAPRVLTQVAQTPGAPTPRGGGTTPLPGGATTPLIGYTPRDKSRGNPCDMVRPTERPRWATATVPQPGTAKMCVVAPPAAASRATSETSRAPSVSRGATVVCNAAVPQENVPNNAGTAGGSAGTRCDDPMVPAEPGACCYLARLLPAQDDLATHSSFGEGERLYDEDWWYWHLEERRHGGAPPDSMFATTSSAGPIPP